MIPVELIEDLTAAAEIRVYHRKAGYPLSGVQVGSSKKRLASLQRRRQSSRPRQSFCYGHKPKAICKVLWRSVRVESLRIKKRRQIIGLICRIQTRR
jgi:hypothetical protein